MKVLNRTRRLREREFMLEIDRRLEEAIETKKGQQSYQVLVEA